MLENYIVDVFKGWTINIEPVKISVENEVDLAPVRFFFLLLHFQDPI